MADSSGQSKVTCAICNKKIFSQCKILLPIDHDMNFIQDPKEEKAKMLHQFFVFICALLNSKGGDVVIHSSRQSHLELFDQSVDDKLNRLIPDDRFYHKVFRRSFVDEFHLVYTVIPSSKNRTFSTLDFKSQSPCNKGLINPTHQQMVIFLKEMSERQSDAGAIGDDAARASFVFRHNEPIILGPGRLFQESTAIQAKAFAAPKTCQKDNDAISLGIYIWNKGKEYIPAFSKLEDGGSVFFGIQEKIHMLEEDVWELAKQVPFSVTPSPLNQTQQRGGRGPQRPQAYSRGHGRGQGRGESLKTDWKIYQDKNRTQSNSTYHVTSDPPLKKTREQKEGVFLAVGRSLETAQRENLRRIIQDKASKDFAWAGPNKPHQDQIEIIFHCVQGSPAPDQCIIEIRVHNYTGICFHDCDGPEALTIDYTILSYHNLRNPSLSPRQEVRDFTKRIPCMEWIRKFYPEAKNTWNVYRYKAS